MGIDEFYLLSKSNVEALDLNKFEYLHSRFVHALMQNQVQNIFNPF